MIPGDRIAVTVLWRSGPENVIGARRTTKEEKEPCHLSLRYPAQIIKEFAFFCELVLQNGFAKGLSAKGWAKDFQATVGVGKVSLPDRWGRSRSIEFSDAWWRRPTS